MSLCYVTKSSVIYTVNGLRIVTFGESRGSDGSVTAVGKIY
jgi:hypothetical protein